VYVNKEKIQIWNILAKNNNSFGRFLLSLRNQLHSFFLKEKIDFYFMLQLLHSGVCLVFEDCGSLLFFSSQ